MNLSQYLPEVVAQNVSSIPAEPRRGGYRAYPRLALAAILLLTLNFAPRSAAQIQVDTSNPVNEAADHCSLQEAIYAAEFGAGVAIDATDADHTYATACIASAGDWSTIELPGGTLTFAQSWGGDAHNPFGPTATPIIFKKITIHGHGTILQWTGTENSRLFAIGGASIAAIATAVPTPAVTGTGDLTLEDVDIQNFHVKGGDGAGGGGGGLGVGGAIYLGGGSLTVQNSTFSGNSATGGNGSLGADGLGGGGGGFSGNGGLATSNGGGGGGGGARGSGGSEDPHANADAGGGGGGTVFDGGNVNVLTPDVGGAGAYLCGGNGGDKGNDGLDGKCSGGGGGGNGLPGVAPFCTNKSGGNGAYGGGGGGGATALGYCGANGGNGGFGGGGGGGGSKQNGGDGGNGGFGGGGGGGADNSGSGGNFGGAGNNKVAAVNDQGDTLSVYLLGGGGGALGGAIFNDGGNVTIQNSTFFSNSVAHGNGAVVVTQQFGTGSASDGSDAGGAIFSGNGTLIVQNSTFSGNAATTSGGGIEAYGLGSFVLANTIVANNGSQECVKSGLVGATHSGMSSTNNLITNNYSCVGVTVTADPQLGLLQLNGGDTRTMAIQYGVSPAVDAGSDSVVSAVPALATAQNGLTRPQGAHADIGAYEAPPPTADLSITKSVSSSTAQPGDTVTYTLTVSNAGPNTANNVSVSDTLPTSYVTFVDCTESTGTGTCTYNGTTITVTYASLAVNASSTVTIRTTVNSGVSDGVSVGNNASVSASDPTDPNTANNTSANVYFTVHNKADLAVTKSVSSNSPYFPATGIEVGDSLTYTVKLTNKGPYDARNVVLSDSAPAGVTFTNCTASTGTCVWSASSASLSLGSLTNGSIVTLTIQATLNFGVTDGSTITNTASVTSTTNDPDPTNNAGTASFTALNNSDLFVTQSTAKLASRQLKYTVNVKNLGKYIGKQLLLNDPIPPGSKFVSITPGSWTCSAPTAGSTGTISCTLSTLAVNATQSLTFVVKVTTPGGVLVNNTASVSAAPFDPNLANNTSTLSTKVGP